MKSIIPLKRCPFCLQTPDFVMYLNFTETWLPHIACKNSSCKIQPKAKYVPIRKSQKKNEKIIEAKIRLAFDNWNSVCPQIAIEGKEFDFENILSELFLT